MILKCALQVRDLWTKTKPQHRELRALLFTMSVWVLLTFPAGHYSEDAGDGAYDLSSLSEKTRISNHL